MRAHHPRTTSWFTADDCCVDAVGAVGDSTTTWTDHATVR